MLMSTCTIRKILLAPYSFLHWPGFFFIMRQKLQTKSASVLKRNFLIVRIRLDASDQEHFLVFFICHSSVSIRTKFKPQAPPSTHTHTVVVDMKL